jgi:hypothetical protein
MPAEQIMDKLETDVSGGEESLGVESQIPDASDAADKETPAEGIRQVNKPADSELSKLRFDVSDLDDDKSTAPSEKEEFEGTFSKLPKLDVLKKEEASKDKDASEEHKAEKQPDEVEASSIQNEQKGKVEVGDKRDYTQFPEELRQRLKHFNNKAFDFVAKELYPRLTKSEAALTTAQKQLEDAQKGITKLPDNYYENPQAFTLDPEFQKISANYDKASFEAEFWTQQLERIESGETFQKLLGYRQGQPVYSEQAKPTARDKVEISSFLNSALNYQRDFETQAKALQKNYVSVHKGAADKVQETMAKFIPWEKDSALLNEKIAVNGGQKTIKEIYEQFMGFVPPQFRSSVMSKAWANLMIVNLIQGNRLAEFDSANKVANTNAQHQAKAQPVGSKAGGGGDKKSLKVVNTEGMDD